MHTQTSIAGIVIPDSKIATGAQELLKEYGNDLLWNHSHRVYLFGALLGSERKMKYDPELLYVAALFHDLGLTKHYSSETERFEVDGANAARQYLTQQGVKESDIDIVWDAIALHTTLGITKWKKPEVHLIFEGVGYDLMGDNFDELTEDTRDAVTSVFPRDEFKNKILPAFLEGFRHKPQTTFGNIKSDVCELLLPGYVRPKFTDYVLNSPWSE